MTKLGETIAVGFVGGALVVFGATTAAAQDGASLFKEQCSACHNNVVHPKGLVYNAAGNVAIIEAVNAKGMGAAGSLADHTSIAAYLDVIKPTINLAPVARDSPGTKIVLGDIKVQAAELNADLKIIANIVTVSPPTKGTVSYLVGNGFALPSYVIYTPFPGQSGIDTWTYQGTGPTENTTVRTASVNIDSAAENNYQGLWWGAPAGLESGWGINFAHQGDTIFASWFTYDTTGKGWWLVMTAPKTAPNTYAGTLYSTIGAPFNTTPYPANAFLSPPTAVGMGALTFSDANNGKFVYTVNGILQNKAITRQVFGTLPVCATATGSLAAASNYQDLWWAAPAGSEMGWGVNLTHQGDTIFATWFTYDLDNSPLWLVATAPMSSPGVYSGVLYRTTGIPFNTLPYPPNANVNTPVGMATFTFSDGNNATFAYTVNGVAQNKAITREIFNPPGTICQ